MFFWKPLETSVTCGISLRAESRSSLPLPVIRGLLTQWPPSLGVLPWTTEVGQSRPGQLFYFSLITAKLPLCALSTFLGAFQRIVIFFVTPGPFPGTELKIVCEAAGCARRGVMGSCSWSGALTQLPFSGSLPFRRSFGESTEVSKCSQAEKMLDVKASV